VGVLTAGTRLRLGDDLLRLLRDWHAAGVRDRLHEVLSGELRMAENIDWERAAMDGSQLCALRGGPRTGPRSVSWTVGGLIGRRQPKHGPLGDYGTLLWRHGFREPACTSRVDAGSVMHRGCERIRP